MVAPYNFRMISDNTNQPRTGLSANWAVREVDHLFHRFARYTRFVFYSKWFLGLFGIALIVALVLYPIFSKDQSGMRVSFISKEMEKLNGPGAAPSMASPVYEGVDKKGQQFKISGALATQVNADLVIIDKVEGQILTGKTFVSLTADKAEYRANDHRIELLGNVNVIHGEGYNFTTQQATIDTTTMQITGKQQITGVGPMGNLLATGFEISDNGKNVHFGGQRRVNVVIDKKNE